METVNFINTEKLADVTERAYAEHKEIIRRVLPEADIQHVGSTAIPNSLTKGDLDIQVRVKVQHFPKAVEELSNLYDTNEGSVKTWRFQGIRR